MCYPKIQYQSGLQAADVEIYCKKHSSIVDVKYNINSQGFQSDNKISLDSSFMDALSMEIKAHD